LRPGQFDADGSLGVPPSVRGQQVAVADNDLAALDATLAANPDVAACILEPTGASWGRVPLDVGFLAGVREVRCVWTHLPLTVWNQQGLSVKIYEP
jgi:glutamate-1-semialdehyde 2,1-aminomutase